MPYSVVAYSGVVMTTPQLVSDLKEIDHLIDALRMAQNFDADDLDDLSWLHGRRRYIQRVLVSRRAQKGKKIVSLNTWRYGSAMEPDIDSHAA